ncbi:MAG TPA: FAD-dependent oxidoreductase, partial [Gemmatimonadaceae bacterium]
VAEAGGDALLVTDQTDVGGQIWRRDVNGSPPTKAKPWLDRVRASHARVLTRATVIAAERRPEGLVFSIERDARVEQRTVKSAILATGARELFLPFPGWTLPGVTGVGGLQALAKGGLAVKGKRVLIAGSGPLLVAVGASLVERGANLRGVIEQAPFSRMIGFAGSLLGSLGVARDAAAYGMSLGPNQLQFGWWVERAEGQGKVERAILSNGSKHRTIDCDYLAVGYGLVPNTELAQLLGCEVTGDAIRVDERQRTTVEGVFAVGECCGVAGVDAALAEGTIAGMIATGSSSPPPGVLRDRSKARAWGVRLASTFALRKDVLHLATADTIVCRCEDVRFDQLDPAWNARQAKLYARVGMGPCQGRVCGPALHAMFGWQSDRVRAPVIPAYLSSLANSTSSRG